MITVFALIYSKKKANFNALAEIIKKGSLSILRILKLPFKLYLLIN